MAASTMVYPDPQYLDLSRRVVEQIISNNHFPMQLQTLLLSYSDDPQVVRQFWIWTTGYGLNPDEKVPPLDTLIPQLQRIIAVGRLSRRLSLFARLGMLEKLQELASQIVVEADDSQDAVKDAVIYNQRPALEVLLANRRTALPKAFLEKMARVAYKLAHYDIYRLLIQSGVEVDYLEFDDIARRDDVETMAALLDTNTISSRAVQQNAHEYNSAKILQLLKNRNLYDHNMGSSILTFDQYRGHSHDEY